VTKPVADRPYIPHKGYGVPADLDNLVDWSTVVERFEREKNYWVATASRDGVSTARPVWGVFVDDTICFGGGPLTRWSRNLTANPKVSLHLEDGTSPVIAEGRVDRLTDPDDARLKSIDDAYEVKYKMRHGPPIWLLKPEVVLTWTQFPKDMTRFRFSD
jgi:Pyridoxamine 5'-phosphate oxidase